MIDRADAIEAEVTVNAVADLTYTGALPVGAVLRPDPSKRGIVEATWQEANYLREFNPDLALWERQKGESTKAHGAFVVFRDLGPFLRSRREVGRRLGKSDTIIRRWAHAYRWQDRADAWDDDQRRLIDGTRREEQEKAIKNHSQASRALLGQALRLLQDQQQKQTPDGRSIQQAAIAIDKAIHHNRLSLGLPTDVTRQDHQLKQMLDEALRTQDAVRAVVEEHLCADCRARVGVELRRIAGKQRNLQDRSGAIF